MAKTETAYTLGTKTFEIQIFDVQLLVRRPLLSDTVFRKHLGLLNSGKKKKFKKTKNAENQMTHKYGEAAPPPCHRGSHPGGLSQAPRPALCSARGPP